MGDNHDDKHDDKHDDDKHVADGAEMNPEGVQRVLGMWRPVIDAVVDTSRGDLDAEHELTGILAELATHDEWRGLGVALRRIADGERDEGSLLEGADVVDGVIVRGVLAEVGEPHPAGQRDMANADQALDEFFALVHVACGEDAQPELNERLQEAVNRMAMEASTQEERALGVVLWAILRGERDPSLEDLSEAHADRVTTLLQSLGEGREG